MHRLGSEKPEKMEMTSEIIEYLCSDYSVPFHGWWAFMSFRGGKLTREVLTHNRLMRALTILCPQNGFKKPEEAFPIFYTAKRFFDRYYVRKVWSDQLIENIAAEIIDRRIGKLKKQEKQL